MAAAKSGDTVKVHYTGKLTDGTVFDSSMDRAPLEFKLGEGDIIEGFERIVAGMSPGEKKSGEIAAEDAYGAHHPDMVMKVDLDQFPDDLVPEVGQRLEMTQDEGDPMDVTVVEVTDELVTLDANHPLAGEALVFEIELVEIT